MCGRARCTVHVDDVGRACWFPAPLRAVDSDRIANKALLLTANEILLHGKGTEKTMFRPSYNVSPGRYMPVVRHASQAGDSSKDDSMEPVVHCMKWGLVPSFTRKNEKPDHFRMYGGLTSHGTRRMVSGGILTTSNCTSKHATVSWEVKPHRYGDLLQFNARSESVHLKSSFRRLLPKSRCVTTVEGFYEWKKDGSRKQPYYVHFKDERPLIFAGLYDSWKDEEGNILYTFTILTTRSSKSLDWLHDRMPVILPDQVAVNSWLNDDLQESSIHKLTQPYEASDLVWYPVTHSMGKPSFDGAECVKEMKPKVASNSQIAQLFGKRHSEHDSNVEHEGITDHQELEEEIPDLSVDQDEDLLTEYDQKSNLAGLEPDQDITQALGKEQQMDITGGDAKSIDKEFRANSQKFQEVSIEQSSLKDGKEDGRKVGQEFAEQTLQSSEVKQNAKGSPVAKRRRLSGLQMATKKGDIRPEKEKQSSLLSFFGKQ